MWIALQRYHYQQPLTVLMKRLPTKIEDLKGLPLNVEKWIHMKDEKKKLKLLQRAQRIYACRDKTEDKKRVFNFGILTLLKSEFCEREISDLTLWKVVTIIK
jgi:hypothetical protein